MQQVIINKKEWLTKKDLFWLESVTSMDLIHQMMRENATLKNDINEETIILGMVFRSVIERSLKEYWQKKLLSEQPLNSKEVQTILNKNFNEFIKCIKNYSTNKNEIDDIHWWYTYCSYNFHSAYASQSLMQLLHNIELYKKTTIYAAIKTTTAQI